MRSIDIEILRFGTSHNYNLSPDHKYIVTCEKYRAEQLSIPCEQSDFNRELSRLRYTAAEPLRHGAIAFFQQLFGQIFDKLKPLAYELQKKDNWLHLRL